MVYATVNDVEVRFGRTLTASERGQVEAWIGDVETEILGRIPDLDARITAGSPTVGVVTRVVASVVVRKLYNPEGLRNTTVSIDDYSTTKTVDQENSSGWLGLTDKDWALLLPGSGAAAFTIRPYGLPGYATWPEV